MQVNLTPVPVVLSEIKGTFYWYYTWCCHQRKQRETMPEEKSICVGSFNKKFGEHTVSTTTSSDGLR